MVWPPTLRAATPVGAAMAIRLLVASARWCSSVDFPVPALPVTKTCSVDVSIASKTSRCSPESSTRPNLAPLRGASVAMVHSVVAT